MEQFGSYSMASNFNTLLTAVLITTAGKIMTALGLCFIVYQGLDTLQGYFLSVVNKQLGQFTNDALQLFYLGGGGEVLNWVFSGYAFALSIKSTSKLTARFKS